MVLGVRGNDLRDIRIDVARLCQILVMVGKATAGGGSTLADTNHLLFTNDDEINGMWVYIFRGTGIGQERQIKDYTASSNQLTVGLAWGTTPDTTSEYIVTRRFGAHSIDQAIDAQLSRYAETIKLPFEDHSLGVNNILNDPEDVGGISSTGRMRNWQWDFWDAANVPNGWTLTNSNSDEENAVQTIGGHRRVGYIQNTGSSAGSAVLSVGNFYKWRGARVRGYGIAQSVTASRLTARVADGVENTNSDAHSGAGGYERLDTGIKTVSDDPTALSVSFQISSGSQISTFLSAFQLVADDDFQEYILPQGLTEIENIYIEKTEFSDYGQYNHVPLDPKYWDIAQGNQFTVRSREDTTPGQDATSHPRLKIRTDLISLPTPARIKIVGSAFPNLIAPPSTTIGGIGTTGYEDVSPVAAPELIKHAAALMLNEQIATSVRSASSSWLREQIDIQHGQYRTRRKAFGRPVRSF